MKVVCRNCKWWRQVRELPHGMCEKHKFYTSAVVTCSKFVPSEAAQKEEKNEEGKC